MTEQTDKADGSPVPLNSLLLGRMALAAGLVRAAAEKCFVADEAETVVSLLDQIIEYSDTIRDTAADMAEVLGCGPETIEAVKAGLGRVKSFRACRGLEGRA